MMNLRKILEEWFYDETRGIASKHDITHAHQQILALIPKREKNEMVSEYYSGYNACISAMEQSMTGER